MPALLRNDDDNAQMHQHQGNDVALTLLLVTRGAEKLATFSNFTAQTMKNKPEINSMIAVIELEFRWNELAVLNFTFHENSSISCANPHQSFLFIFYYLISSFFVRCPKTSESIIHTRNKRAVGTFIPLKVSSFSLHFLSLSLASSNDISYNISVWQAKAQIEKMLSESI